MDWHRLLRRQMKRHLGNSVIHPPVWEALLSAVNEAYFQFDADRAAIERSLELSSIELQQEHSEMRAVYERLIFSSVDGIFAFDRDCCYTVWNPAMERIMGISRLQTLGKCAFDLFPTLRETGEERYFQEALAGKTVFFADRLHVMPQSQAHAYFEMHYSPLFNETQMIIGGLAIMRDITQRKLAEEAQQRQHDYLLALQEMALSLNTHLELAELLSNITTRASALLATEHVFLILIEPDGVALVNEFSLGIFASGAGKRISFMEGLVEKVRQTKQGIVLNSDVDMLEITYMSIQQCAGIPLINGTEVVGLLGAVCLSGAPPFREGEIALLKQLAQLASIAINQDALNAANARLAAMALTDPLTGLSNHGCVMDQLDKALQECKHSGDQCAMLFIDIDHFKNINDTWGHRTGDAVLREVSKRLTSGIRQTDIVGRYGGEEFVILLLHLDEKEACEIAEQFRATLAAEPCKWFGEDGILMEIPITASIGVAAYPRHGTTREALIEAADSAMYYAKHHGRNCVSLVEMREASPLPTSELPEPKVAA